MSVWNEEFGIVCWILFVTWVVCYIVNLCDKLCLKRWNFREEFFCGRVECFFKMLKNLENFRIVWYWYIFKLAITVNNYGERFHFSIRMLLPPRKRSCGKVMFLNLSVSHSDHRAEESPWQRPPEQKPLPLYGKEGAVRIILEWILVANIYLSKYVFLTEIYSTFHDWSPKIVPAGGRKSLDFVNSTVND